MSVPVHERPLSKLKVFTNARDLHMMITDLLLRDFGTKKKLRIWKITCNFELQDKEIFDELGRKYNFGKTITEEYPEYLIDHFRTKILNILDEMIDNIVSANSIFNALKIDY